MGTVETKASLAHYGVIGQKWGVIRDKVAKAHALKEKVANTTVGKYVSSHEDHKTAQEIKLHALVAGVRTLSNKDLNHVIKRMDLEVKFRDLKTVKHKQSLLGKGVFMVGRMLRDTVVTGGATWISRPFSGVRPPSSTAPQHGNVVVRSIGATPLGRVVDSTFREN